MKTLLMTYETALDYLDMDEEQFDNYVAPNVTTLRFEDELFYLTDQLDEAIYWLIGESMVKTQKDNPKKDFTLHLVD
jgi:hypothetical protein